MTSDQLSLQATFGELLRRWRRNHLLSQAAFGALFTPKVHSSTVAGWESGKKVPSFRSLRQIVALTGIPAHLALEAQEAVRP